MVVSDKKKSVRQKVSSGEEEKKKSSMKSCKSQKIFCAYIADAVTTVIKTLSEEMGVLVNPKLAGKSPYPPAGRSVCPPGVTTG